MGLGLAIGLGVLAILLLCQEAPRRLAVSGVNNADDKVLNITKSSHPALSGCADNGVCMNMLQNYDFSTETPERACESIGCTQQDLALFRASIEEVITTGEVEAQCPAGICVGSYIYINDGAARTYSEAEVLCDQYYGLATIVTEKEFECARNLITDSAAWIGLQSVGNDEGSFTYLDGTDCPIEYNGKYGPCVPSSWWRYKGRPRCSYTHRNEYGSFCVNIDDNYIDNDIHCDKTLLALLCNGKPRLSTRRRRRMMYIGNNPSSNDQYYQYIIFGSILLFIIIIFICIWCFRQTNSVHTIHDKVEIKEDEKA